MNLKENLIPAPGAVYLLPEAFHPLEAQRFMSALLKEVPWTQKEIVLFGKRRPEPRLTAWFGDPGIHYRYSGIFMTPTPWTPLLLEIKSKVESICALQFNSVLLNLYRNETDSMGWHRDNEKELGINPEIASLSLGASRKFQIRRYGTKDERKDLILDSGSLLLMAGETQTLWEHGIPKQSKPCGPRINLTFRMIQK